MKSSTLVILAAVLAFTNANERTEREAQFNQNYLPGSLSTNINNAGAHPGSFTGQQVFSAGSYANNVAYGRKKREAQFNQNYLPGSFSTNINNNPVFPVPGYLGLQNPGYGNSLSANRELGAGYGASLGAGLGASFGAGYGSNFVQNYGFGSSATNIGRK